MAVTSPEPKTPHLADAALRPFIQPNFDPAAYLNTTLPPLHLSSTPVSQRQNGSVMLGDLSSQTNTLLSHLNAQASRLTNVLTQLTDDILRSGGRLAYEVEVLRGETIGLSETLNETLKSHIELFVPCGLSTAKNRQEEPAAQSESATSESQVEKKQTADEPDYLTSLRTLTRVRQRLESVIHLFGEAMRWQLPSSETSTFASSFVSVSAPDSNSPSDPSSKPGSSAAQDEKARAFAETLRTEIADLIVSDKGGDLRKGYETAMERVMALRELAGVWKGTVEEKPRARFVEALAKLAEDRLRELEREAETGRFDPNRGGTPVGRSRRQTQSGKVQQAEKGVGFLDNLYKLRGSGS
jgi:hypothetical protein